jgi:hypothetical protein
MPGALTTKHEIMEVFQFERFDSGQRFRADHARSHLHHGILERPFFAFPTQTPTTFSMPSPDTSMGFGNCRLRWPSQSLRRQP